MIYAAAMKSERTSQSVDWYRSPVPKDLLKELHQRSDALGLLQSLGYLGTLLLTGTLAFYSVGHWSIPVTIALIFLHGTCFSFQINAVHELGHGTVFRTRFLNGLFVRIFAFLGWINFEMFEASHARHHRYTLHPPDDLEVVLPMRVMVRHFFMQGFIDPMGFYNNAKGFLRVACGKISGEWMLELFPESASDKQNPPIRWAQTVLIGHGLILIVSVAFKLWMIPVLVTFAPFYGGWLFFLCNHTQHIGLQDNVSDFRLCCRTFTLNPAVQFLYWHMNYHTEHHMYAAVPCYKLGRLHALIRHDLPPCPHGLIATWQEIASIQKRQDEDPSYQHVPTLPSLPTPECETAPQAFL